MSKGDYNRTKTHCKYGHLFDAANTYYHKDGSRRCRACARERAATNRDKRTESLRKYRERNGDKIREQAREYARKKRLAAGMEVRPAQRLEAIEAAGRVWGQGRRTGRSQADPNYHRNYYQQNRDRAWVKWLWSAHGMRPEDWAGLWDAQDGKCYLCDEEMEGPKGGRSAGTGSAKVAIDHDHSCCPPDTSCPTCRRGLAHTRCNQTIGLVGDSPERLRRMADALEGATLAVAERRAKANIMLALF